MKPQHTELSTGACKRDGVVGCGWCILEANNDLLLMVGAAAWVGAALGGLLRALVPVGDQMPSWHQQQQLCRAKLLSPIHQHLPVPV